MLSITPIPAFTDNYIWCLADTTTGHALVVDPGQAEPVHKHLKARGLTLDTILITHHHPDHTGGVQDLARTLKPSRVVGPDGSPYPHISHPVRAGDGVVWEDITFTVHSIPGHTLDHIAFHSDTPVDGRGILFCGDTLFACGCGRIFEGTPEQMHRSLATLRQLPDTTAVYCGHEYTLANLRFARSWLPQDQGLARYEQECQARRKRGEPTLPSTMALERQLNPFLRWDDPVLVEAARDYAAQQGLPADSETAIFAAVRHGKDHF